MTLRHRPTKRKVVLLEWRDKGVYIQIMKAFKYLNNAQVIIDISATVTCQNVQAVSSLQLISSLSIPATSFSLF